MENNEAFSEIILYIPIFNDHSPSCFLIHIYILSDQLLFFQTFKYQIFEDRTKSQFTVLFFVKYSWIIGFGIFYSFSQNINFKLKLLKNCTLNFSLGCLILKPSICTFRKIQVLYVIHKDFWQILRIECQITKKTNIKIVFLKIVF